MRENILHKLSKVTHLNRTEGHACACQLSHLSTWQSVEGVQEDFCFSSSLACFKNVLAAHCWHQNISS